MTLYERGFSEGEQQGFRDGHLRKPRRTRPDGEMGDYARGYWDGYTPRTLAWSLRTPPCRAPAEVDEVAA